MTLRETFLYGSLVLSNALAITGADAASFPIQKPDDAVAFALLNFRWSGWERKRLRRY